MKKATKKEWYEKYIGFSFNDDGREVILKDTYRYEDGRKCYELYYPDTKETCITDYAVFKKIVDGTVLPGRQSGR